MINSGDNKRSRINSSNSNKISEISKSGLIVIEQFLKRFNVVVDLVLLIVVDSFSAIGVLAMDCFHQLMESHLT